jgi:hypothetical protein
MVFLVAAISGCDSSERMTSTASRMELASVEWDAAMTAAEQTMREFFEVDRIDRRRGVIKAVPTRELASNQGLLGRDKLSSPRSVRRIAELRLKQGGGGVIAECSILIQNSESLDDPVYRQMHTSQDTPNQTPLEENLGLDSRDGQVWSTTGEDHSLERAVLAALAERLETSR